MTSEEVKSGDMDVASLSNIELAEKIRTFGVDPGPIVASTRKLYEKKLLRLLEQGGVAPTTTAANNSGLNGSLQADRYSDTEEEEEEDDDEEEEQQTAAAHGQTGEVNEIAIQTSFQSPFTTYSTKDARLGGGEDTSLFVSPSGISATRRRPIRSCAEGNWGDFATDSASKFSGLGNSVSRPAGQGPSTATVPAAASSAAAAKGSGLASAVPMWVRLVTFVAVCMFIALVYYALEENVQFAVPFETEQGDAAPGEAVAAGGDDGGGATAE